MSHDPFDDTASRDHEDPVLIQMAEQLVKTEAVEADAMELYRDRASGARVPLDVWLVREQVAPEDTVQKALSDVSGLPMVRLSEKKVLEPPERYVSARIAARYRVAPIKINEQALTLACPRLLTADDREQLRLLLGQSVAQALCRRRDMRESLKHYYGVAIESFLELTEKLPRGQTPDISVYVRDIIEDAAVSGATDIHFEPTGEGLDLRYRIDGVLQPITLPSDAAPLARAIVSSIKVMAQLKIDEKRLPQDGRFDAMAGDEHLDIRVSVLPGTHGEAVNLRLLKRRAQFLSLRELGLMEPQRRVFERIIDRSYGMVLFTGPTGSGKTTSLYAALSQLNTTERKIVTLEDPVEYDMDGIQQMQVHADIGFTFASGLRSILRHDPDVVLVGEIRDSETARIAVSAAMTGHLVFSTLHTNDAPSALVRLADMGVEPFMIPSSVAGVVAQRLVRTICPVCREPVALDPARRADLLSAYPELAAIETFYHGVGCPECRYTGYSGRLAIFEMLTMNDAIGQLVVERAPSARLLEAARDNGLVTLRHYGWKRVADGVTTVEEVLRVT